MRRHPGRRELAVFAVGYLTYFGVRAVTEGRVDRAFDNAARLLDFERYLGIAWERTFQSAVAGSQVLRDIAAAVYVYGHWPVLIVAGVLLFHYRRAHYYTLRNACLLTGLLGLFVFALFPVAPPRLTGLTLMSTMADGGAAYRQILPPSLVNQYAAMPSFHAGWNLAVGIVVFQATRHWALRAFAVAMPIAMAFSVIATANHFVIDVIVGVALVLLALALPSPGRITRAHRAPSVHGHDRGIGRARRVLARRQLPVRRTDLPARQPTPAHAVARRPRQASAARPLGHHPRAELHLRAPESRDRRS
jgi:hypothetical protein